jgi:integrase/recombinase XerD
VKPSPAVAGFLDWLAGEQGRAANTVSAYRSDLAAYEQWAGDVATADDATVEAYVRALAEEGRKPASIRRALVAIRALHRYLGHEGAAGTVAWDAPDVPPSAPDVLSDDEVDRLLAAAEGDAAFDRRDRAMLAVLAGGGLRISELVGLDIEALGDGGRTVAVVGHGERDRVATLEDRAVDALARWLAPEGRGMLTPGRSTTTALFVNARGGRLSRQGAWAIVHARGERAGLGDRVTPQVLRNSFAARLLAAGAPPRTVHDRLGHAHASARG